MATYKNLIGVAGAAFTTLGTVPVNRAWIIKSAIAAHAGESTTTQAATLNIVDGSTTIALANSVSVASATSVNLLAGTTVLTAGQILKCRLAVGMNMTKSGTENVPWTPTRMVANTAGTTLIAATALDGIYRTTDEGASWTRVSSLAVATFGSGSITNAAVYVAATSTFYIYTSATAALKSTDDGLTWSAQVTVLAPTKIIKNGATLVGAAIGGTQLVSSTDGITYANMGVVVPSGTIADFCWSGTNYVVASANAAGIHYSTNGAAWTTLSVGGTSPQIIASDGAGTILIAPGSTSQIYYSSNHGVSVTATGTASNTPSFAFYDGTRLVLDGASVLTTSPQFFTSAAPTVVGDSDRPFQSIASRTIVTATKVYGFPSSNTGGLFRTSNIAVNSYGVDMSVHLLEEVA